MFDRTIAGQQGPRAFAIIDKRGELVGKDHIAHSPSDGDESMASYWDQVPLFPGDPGGATITKRIVHHLSEIAGRNPDSVRASFSATSRETVLVFGAKGTRQDSPVSLLCHRSKGVGR